MGDIGIEESINTRYSFWVREALDELPYSFTITDPSISGHPIVFASRDFLKLCGYSRQEVIGKNGRMFQGIMTNRRSVTEIRHAIIQETTIQITLLNYTKNGTPYWILFHMFPVFDHGRLVHFVGIQIPIIIPPTHVLPLLGFCRREVYDLPFISNLPLPQDDDTPPPRPPRTGDLSHATDLEKRGAKTAMINILSILTHYSQLTGRLVSDKRCHCSTYIPASLNLSLARIKQSFVLTDPHKTDIPIVYASEAFLELTGYTRHEVLGQNCRFLSGQETDVSTQLQITNSIQTRKPCCVCILNYRKDGSPFWNSLQMSAVRNASGKIAYFVEVQMEMEVNPPEKQNLSLKMRQLSVVGAVKVAVRSSASDL
uniref:Putative LOV domain-containing protein n=1 Tax=Curio rowleyanus TaxID=189246 RepID=A0A126WV62_9ASTR|nr:putative LOV domain-containing protein [Curio rowleyanus]